MDAPVRMLDKGEEPTTAAVAEWVGARAFKRWVELTDFIEGTYPGVFQLEWLYAGKNHGWSLRFKKSKPLCTFVPERGRFKVLVVFGAAEREKVEEILPTVASHVRDDYLQATTYHDGKWVLVEIDSQAVLTDVEQLLLLKRKPPRAVR